MVSFDRLMSIIGDIPALARQPSHLDSANHNFENKTESLEPFCTAAANESCNDSYNSSKSQLPALLLLENCLSEINKARESDRARRGRRNQQHTLSSPIPESLVVAESAPCHRLYGATSNSSGYIVQASSSCHSEIAAGDQAYNKEPVNGIDFSTTTTAVIAQAQHPADASPSLIIAPVRSNLMTKTVATQRMMSDRDFLAKAVQARMKSYHANNHQKQKPSKGNLSNASPTAAAALKLVQNEAVSSLVSLDATDQNGKDNSKNTPTNFANQKPLLKKSPHGWTCSLCLNRNIYDRAQCQVCGRHRGFHLATSTLANNGTMGGTKKQLKSMSSKIVATFPTPMTTKKKTDDNISRSSSLPVVPKGIITKEKNESFFLKHRLDYELDERTALANDIASALTFVRSANSDNRAQNGQTSLIL